MRACPVCQIEFPEPAGAHQFKVYCSRRCKVTAKARRAAVAANKQRPRVQCGTHSGYVMHRKCGEDACAECKAATSTRALARRRARGVGPKGIAPVRPCSTCGSLTARSNFCSAKCRAEFERPCAECGEVFHPTDSNTRYCSIPCRRKWNNRLGIERGKPWAVYTYGPYQQARSRLEGALRRGARVPGELISPAEVFERDGWICGLCGTSVDRSLKYPDPMSVSLDHVVPVSKGGMHSLANVQCAHLFCNVSKGNRVA